MVVRRASERFQCLLEIQKREIEHLRNQIMFRDRAIRRLRECITKNTQKSWCTEMWWILWSIALIMWFVAFVMWWLYVAK